jgi:hypothetical protein
LADYFAYSFKNDPLFAQETARIMRTTPNCQPARMNWRASWRIRNTRI